jgi:hypothetical protein
VGSFGEKANGKKRGREREGDERQKLKAVKGIKGRTFYPKLSIPQ